MVLFVWVCLMADDVLVLFLRICFMAHCFGKEGEMERAREIDAIWIECSNGKDGTAVTVLDVERKWEMNVSVVDAWCFRRKVKGQRILCRRGTSDDVCRGWGSRGHMSYGSVTSSSLEFYLIERPQHFSYSSRHQFTLTFPFFVERSFKASYVSLWVIHESPAISWPKTQKIRTIQPWRHQFNPS
jgi:hypothetical protein